MDTEEAKAQHSASPERAAWRKTTERIAESAAVQLFLMGLLLVDIVVIAMEFLIRGTSCGGTADTLSKTQSDVQHVLHYISIGALLVFALHLAVEWLAVGLDAWRRNSFIMDVLIIGTALLLEVGNFKQADLVTILLLSRVVRVVHAVKHTITHDDASHEAEHSQARDRDAFETETKNPLEADAGGSVTAISVAANVERIMTDDAEFTATLPVPDDLKAINDVTKLRLLVAEERKLREQLVR